MKYCEEYAALLDAFVDGECTPEEEAKVREHLQTCEGCRVYLNAALLMRNAFPDEESVELPAGLADGVMAAVRAEAAPRKRTVKQWANIWLPRAACLALAVGIGIFWMAVGGAGRSSGPVTAAAADNVAIENFSAESGDAETAGISDSAMKATSNGEESVPASSENFSEQAAFTAEGDFSTGCVNGDVLAEGENYARWAAFTSAQVGSLLDSFNGRQETDGTTGESYTLYELDEEDFNAVIDALDGWDAVSRDDGAASALCAIAVYSEFDSVD